MSSSTLTILLIASSLALVACNEEKNESDGTTGADTQATGGSTTGDATTTTGSGSTSTSATDGTTGDATTTTGGTGETDGDATTTTGTGGGGSLPASCEAYCANIVDCFDFGPEDLDDCLDYCLFGWGGDATCEAALIEVNYCYADATCRQLEGPDPCVIEDAAAEIACGGADECLYDGRGDAEYCWIDQECPGTFLSLDCEEDLCTCYDYDLGPVGTCANDVCVDGVDTDALLQKAVECCGWQP